MSAAKNFYNFYLLGKEETIGIVGFAAGFAYSCYPITDLITAPLASVIVCSTYGGIYSSCCLLCSKLLDKPLHPLITMSLSLSCAYYAYKSIKTTIKPNSNDKN